MGECHMSPGSGHDSISDAPGQTRFPNNPSISVKSEDSDEVFVEDHPAISNTPNDYVKVSTLLESRLPANEHCQGYSYSSGYVARAPSPVLSPVEEEEVMVVPPAVKLTVNNPGYGYV